VADLARTAEVVKLYDGDTFTARVALGWNVSVTNRVRVNGINAPELATPEGQAAEEYAATLVHPGDTVTLTSHGPNGTFDNYGRLLCTVGLADGRDFGSLMVESGNAVAYTVRALEVGEG
jgi:endonuclease YncB( thermonuclease family)